MNTEPATVSGISSILLPSRTQLFVALGGYFALHILIRTLLSTSTDLDEAEQIVLTQKLEWGYGPQPPLYTWIQFAFFKIFGVSVFALSLFKGVLLFGLFAFTYASAWRITKTHMVALVAVCFLMFLPQVSWESQRDLTHSVLAATMSVVTWHVFLSLLKQPRAMVYLLFGLCVGLGFLSKYNYALLPAGMVVAALTIKEFRPMILDPRFLLALAIASLIILPNGIWLAHYHDLGFATSAKFHIQENALSAATTGLGRLLISIIAFVATVVVISGIILGRAKPQKPVSHCQMLHQQLLARTLITILIALTVLVVAFHITAIRERWLQPFLILVPLLVAVWAQPRLQIKHARRLVALALLVGVIVLVVIPTRVIYGHHFDRDEPLMRPYEQLARQLGSRLRPDTVIVADRTVLAGNMRLNLPGLVAVTPELAALLSPKATRFAMIWRSTRSENIPKNLQEFYQKKTGVPLSDNQIEFITAHYHYQPSRQDRLSIVQLPED